MASITLQVGPTFPAGTSVSAYKASDWNPAVAPSGSPPGSVVATATVAAAGTLTLTGLSEGTTYFAYASVSSQDRYLRFTVDSAPGTGADPQPTVSESTSKGYQQGTSTGTVALLSALVTIPAGATKVLITPTAAVRIRDDGTNPTAAVGYPIAANTEWLYDGDQIAALRVINAATLDCWFFA